MAGSAPSILAALVGLGAGAGLWLFGGTSTPTGPSREDVSRVADEVNVKVLENLAGAKSRADGLAQFPTLGGVNGAVATDAKTVLDMIERPNAELTFRPVEGETIEIGQVTDKGKVISLLKLPKGSTASANLSRVGPGAVADPSGQLLVSHVVSLPVSGNPEVKEGRVAVIRPIPLAPYVDKLNALAVPAKIEVDGKTAAATQTPFPAGAEPTAIPLGAATGARVLAFVRPPGEAKIGPLQLGGIGAAALGLILALVLWPRRKSKAASAGIPSPLPDPTPVPFAQTNSGVPWLNAPRSNTELSQFGRYTVLRRLGSGGMAEVFLARISGEAGFEKKVALKIIHKHLSLHQQVVDHFLDEARLASQISHPNIVQIIDLGKSGDDYFIAMEYIDGYDLDTLMEMGASRGALVPARVALAVLRKICDGLHAAHTAPDAYGKPLELVHRDVKAENVLVSRVGEIKVTDFGIAKANVRAAKTQIGMVKGTAAYMAPEQRIGQSVDRRADVYGVGAIAYEVFTGQEVNLDLATLAHLGKEGWPHLPPVTQYRPDLPPEIDRIIFKALAYEKDDRWPTAQSFEEALEQYAIQHNLVCSDKLVAQWVEQEIAYLEAQAKSGGAA